jgi:hypothetical protein
MYKRHSNGYSYIVPVFRIPSARYSLFAVSETTVTVFCGDCGDDARSNVVDMRGLEDFAVVADAVQRHELGFHVGADQPVKED